MIAAGLLLFALRADATIKLSPQKVVDLVLSQGLQAKQISLTAQRSYKEWELARGVFDPSLKITPGYEYSEAENLAGSASPVSRLYTTNVTAAKQFSTGTNLSLAFDHNQQNDTPNPNSTSRQPVAALNSLTGTIRQSLWSNAFGYADRLAVEIGAEKIWVAEQTREENLEQLLLDSMTAYWNAYSAAEQLKASLAAREKYQQLVSNVRKKAGYNLSTPGELPRLEAELAGAESRVKLNSAAYLNSIESLFTVLQWTMPEEVEFDVSETLPPLPKLEAKKPDGLRAMRLAERQLQLADMILGQVRAITKPKFDLIAKAKTTGVDTGPEGARAEMLAGTHPGYYIGFEFETSLDSSKSRGSLTDAALAKSQAEIDLRLKRDQLSEQMQTLERLMTARYAAAQLAEQTVQWRARVVREVEGSYRQGRQPLVELIRANNELFSAQYDLAKAVGDYHIALNQLAAARD